MKRLARLELTRGTIGVRERFPGKASERIKRNDSWTRKVARGDGFWKLHPSMRNPDNDTVHGSARTHPRARFLPNGLGREYFVKKRPLCNMCPRSYKGPHQPFYTAR
uniref:Uncharacterized protein n=1 Tax=Cannabis sativa TaxID=3483 RepID=A0A803NLV5_CANSA